MPLVRTITQKPDLLQCIIHPSNRHPPEIVLLLRHRKKRLLSITLQNEPGPIHHSMDPYVCVYTTWPMSAIYSALSHRSSVAFEKN